MAVLGKQSHRVGQDAEPLCGHRQRAAFCQMLDDAVVVEATLRSVRQPDPDGEDVGHSFTRGSISCQTLQPLLSSFHLTSSAARVPDSHIEQ
ncbi:hypothetical protein HEK616_06560 [Streptomyces nigrescens]|uniref:Uncharacterized protein n=1 Tax=Streptomyces nigrescens TaxID=1920 RepID=A0ABM7ZMP3_STRNI|nr:hypothetical protein HEK616_06560 [Streptomyces nigrescens]